MHIFYVELAVAERAMMHFLIILKVLLRNFKKQLDWFAYFWFIYLIFLKVYGQMENGFFLLVLINESDVGFLTSMVN